jgi:hypothetical protein
MCNETNVHFVTCLLLSRGLECMLFHTFISCCGHLKIHFFEVFVIHQDFVHSKILIKTLENRKQTK